LTSDDGDEFRDQAVDPGFRIAGGLFGDADVAGGGFGAGMAELFLNGAEVEPGFDHVGGVAVAQGMDGDVLVDAGIEDGALEAFLDIAAVHGLGCRGLVGGGTTREQEAWVAVGRPELAEHGEGSRG